MNILTMQEKLDIVNNGGKVDETEEYGSWKGIKIRKGKKLGRVIKDFNGYYRELTVRFNNGLEETIKMNNMGDNPYYIHQYEWYNKQGKVWYSF